jgi:hypothetical protein
MTPAQETTVIGAGASVTAIAHIAAYAVLVTPILHVLAILITCAVGVATVWYTIKKGKRIDL